jgi:Tol biopolymer transport system component
VALLKGARLGPYEITGPLGSGGMGDVYRARDTRLARDVAIKVLPAAFVADPDRLRRSEQEARAAAALNHPNIVAVYDIGTHDGAPYIVSELLEGRTLRARLEERAARRPDPLGQPISHATDSGSSSDGLPVRTAIDYAVQIAHGLAAAHEKGIAHRDLKPENLFLTSDNFVKILDFGLAKLTQPGTTDNLATGPAETTPGVVMGTIGYMAPEQVRGLAADHRSDIFAFGVVLYEMVSGRRAFRSETSAETMTAILHQDPPELTTIQPAIPAALSRIVARCMEKNPAARFQSTRDLAFALEALSGSSAASPSASVVAVAPRWRRERLAWMLAGLALMVAAALAVPAVRDLRRATQPKLIVIADIVTPPTTEAASFALSPDGRQLAFVATSDGRPTLWVRPLDQVAARPLAGTEGASVPFWKPDGTALGFFANGKLKRIDLGSEAPIELADTSFARGGTWSRDDVIVFTSAPGPLMRIAAGGGTPTVATRLGAGQATHRWPQFLPDGRRFLFFIGFVQPDVRGVYVGSLDDSEATRVTDADSAPVFAPPGFLLFVRQGVLVARHFDPDRGLASGPPIPVAQGIGEDGTGRGAFAVSATGVLAHRAGGIQRRQLVWVDRAGVVRGNVGEADEAALAEPELSPDGSRVAVVRSVKGETDVWLIDVGRGVPTRFTLNTGVDFAPLWSPPDWRRVVFRANRAAASDLFEKPVNGGDERPLLVTTEDKVPLSWSPDGRLLLFASANSKTGSDLWMLPFDGAPGGPLSAPGKRFPVLATAFNESAGQFSPDGQWIAYQSDESGRPEIYVRPYPGEGRTQVSSAGGTHPRWHPIRKELFFVARDARMMAVRLALGKNPPTIEPEAPVELFETRFASGANIPGDTLSKPQYAVARDGRFLMNVAVEEAVAAPITIVLNWDAGIQK